MLDFSTKLDGNPSMYT